MTHDLKTMTRINVILPKLLSDKHLLAEYRELPRIFTAVKKLDKKPDDIPEHYVLGKGHCKFFYDKSKYLFNRYHDIAKDLHLRGFKINWDLVYKIRRDAIKEIPHWSWNDWNPTHEDYYLNMARICKRSNFKLVLDEIYGERNDQHLSK